MSIQLSTRVMHIKDQSTGSYDTVDIIKGRDAVVDDELSDESENPVQNKVIAAKVGDLKVEINQLSESIAPVESTATATSAHAVGELFMMGETLLVALSAIAVGDTITTEGGSPNAAVTTLSSNLLKDVQVNGTSVVTNGLANVPLATNTTVGVMKPNTDRGLQMVGVNIGIIPTLSSTIKKGKSVYSPVIVGRQHESIFYGLAKAASDTTQSASSNPVGTYTDAAKIAIQKMLGIYEPPFELLNDITLDAEGGIDLTADSNGTPYNLLRAYIYIYYAANLTTATSGYDRYTFFDSNNNYITAETAKYSASTNSNFKHVLVEKIGGFAFVRFTRQTVIGNVATWLTKQYSGVGGGVLFDLGNIVRIKTNRGDVEPAGTRIRIWGQRAY